MNDFNDDNSCFACGQKNPIGLHLSFIYEEETDSIVSTTTFSKSFQGWQDVLHGGIITTVLDEVMIKAAHHKGYKCATIELSVRFKQPVFLGKEYTIKGRFKNLRGKIVFAEGFLLDKTKNIYASATGKFFLIHDQ